VILKSLVVCALLLAVAWDADGDPFTENLPHAVSCEGVRVAEGPLEAAEDTGGAPPAHRPWSPWRRRRAWRRSRETAWRSIAVPERGP